MPTFEDSAVATAPVEEVWKLLYDPARFASWWAGVGRVEPPAAGGAGDYVMFPDGFPDFPMPQALRPDQGDRSVTISCLVSDLVFEWRIAPTAADATRITVHVEIPERETHRLAAQRAAISASLRNLAALAGS